MFLKWNISKILIRDINVKLSRLYNHIFELNVILSRNTGSKIFQVSAFLPGRFLPYIQLSDFVCLTFDDTLNLYSIWYLKKILDCNLPRGIFQSGSTRGEFDLKEFIRREFSKYRKLCIVILLHCNCAAPWNISFMHGCWCINWGQLWYFIRAFFKSANIKHQQTSNSSHLDFKFLTRGMHISLWA